MLPIKAWRIFYADGSTFDSTQGTWAEAAPFGVEAVVYYHDPPCKTLEHGTRDGVYHYRGDGWPDDVKMGLWMDADGYYRIVDLAARSVEP
jgi:hypothetical protein